MQAFTYLSSAVHTSHIMFITFTYDNFTNDDDDDDDDEDDDEKILIKPISESKVLLV